MNYKSDVDAILKKHRDQGGDFWATADGRLAVGSPFSTLESLQLLYELGIDRNHEVVRGALDLLLDSWREEGRYNLAPGGTLYPCHTANTARVLCRFGYTDDERVQKSLSHLLEIQHYDSGWRCTKFAFGRGPGTEFSNPGVTLFALDAFRFTKYRNKSKALEQAVESLLDHWTVRKPIGPCRFGIGTLFMQVEYPFLRYNIFSYVYVLSFYKQARRDRRFLEAFEVLESKADKEGNMLLERPNRKLAGLSAFSKGKPSAPAKRRFKEILSNLKK